MSVSSERVRVVIADDSVLLREGTARLLEEAGFDVVGQAVDGDDLMLKVRSYAPDIAIVDIRMPPTHTDEGLRAAQQIRERYPATACSCSRSTSRPSTRPSCSPRTPRASATCSRIASPTSRLRRRRAAGRRRRIGARPDRSSRCSSAAAAARALDDVTPRELEVLELMAEGRSNKAIAERMVVTERAVEKHVTSIFAKLRLPTSSDDHRRVLAVLTYLQRSDGG